MKKVILSLMLASILLASCSKDPAGEFAPQTQATTFTLSVEESAATPAAAKVTTRGAITPARYVMEVWSADGTTPENVFDNGTNHMQITSGNSFMATLDKTKAYTCLFWADDNVVFNAASLKSISLNSGKEVTEAYHANLAVAKGKNPAVSVTLKRAVAKITLTETDGVKTTDDIALRFTNIYPLFDVLTGAASGTAAEWTKTVKPAAATGVVGTFYFFAKPTPELTEFKFTYAAENEKIVSNVPYQMNHATNVKGEYSNTKAFTFTITADDQWENPDNEVYFPKAPYRENRVVQHKFAAQPYKKYKNNEI